LPPRREHYHEAVDHIDRYARERFGKAVLPFAVRWVLDHPGVSVALWGVRRVSELEPVDEMTGWKLDDEARAFVDALLAKDVLDPVGPEFMAPPEHSPKPHPRAKTRAAAHP
jgi:aryl-alcohol dehydrogenase-like predicted oxidoreductase